MCLSPSHLIDPVPHFSSVCAWPRIGYQLLPTLSSSLLVHSPALQRYLFKIDKIFYNGGIIEQAPHFVRFFASFTALVVPPRDAAFACHTAWLRNTFWSGINYKSGKMLNSRINSKENMSDHEILVRLRNISQSAASTFHRAGAGGRPVVEIHFLLVSSVVWKGRHSHKGF